MALNLQFSTTVRNAILDAIESTIGTAPTLEIWSGTMPANCAAADAGDGAVLASYTLASDWMDAASSGSKAFSSLPLSDTSADATGTATHFRIKKSATVHMQGTVGTGTHDMVIDNASIVSGQTVNITAATLTAANS